MIRSQGFIALISILIVSAIALLIGAGVLLHAIDDVNSDIAMEHASRAHAAATYCAERALASFRASNSYAGNEMLSINGDTCQILALGGTGNTSRTLRTTSTVMGATRKISITIANRVPKITITSWQEVADF